MDEQRKYAILFAATTLAARKLHEIGDKQCPARECAISDAITKAEQILKRIDERWRSKADLSASSKAERAIPIGIFINASC